MGRLTMLKGSVFAVGLLMLWALPAQADPDVLIINNGLAPPNPDNVIDASDVFSGHTVTVQNVGCDLTFEFPCVFPGDPTTASLVDGGFAGNTVLVAESSSFVMSGSSVGFKISAFDSSSVTMSGGLVGSGGLTAEHSSSIAMSGGEVTADLVVNDSASATMTGGSVRQIRASSSASITIFGGEARSNGLIVASNSSSIVIVGTDFEVNGDPAPYGLIAEGNATLTGTLASGEPIDNPICHNGGACAGPVRTGSIYLAPPPPYDLTSSWDIEFSDPITGTSGTCDWVVTQNGTIYGDSIPLLIESNCDITGSGFAFGALDLNTGFFSAVGAAPQACTTQSVFGTVAGTSTSGTSFCVDLVGGAFSASFTGTSVPEVECNENEDCDTGETCNDNNECVPDSDGDGVPDADDVCLGGDDSLDTDQDGVPDACDIDMTGNWAVETSAGPCTSWQVTQDGTVLSMKAVCEFEIDAGPPRVVITAVSGTFLGGPDDDEFWGEITRSGTEVPATGDFEVSGEFRDSSTDLASVCRYVSFVGTTTETTDGNTKSQSAEGTYECWALPPSVTGEPGDPFCPEWAAVDLCPAPPPIDPPVLPCCILTGSFTGFFDSDGDGVGDHIDICPGGDDTVDTETLPDGTPNPDGIPDACDACPEEPEDYDGYQDEDGCPDPEIDMTGTWDSITVAGDCTWEIVQTGTQLGPFFIACGQEISAYASEATIDANTGEFNVTAKLSPATCNLTDLSAQGTSDGATANGTYECYDAPGTVFCPDDLPPTEYQQCPSLEGLVPCCYLTGSFSGTRVPDFVISDALGGGDCTNTRFNGTWDDVANTCTVTSTWPAPPANVTIHAGESLTVAQEATLVIPNGAAMTFNGGSDSRELRVYGTLANNGVITLKGGDGSLSAGLAVLEGTLTNNGDMHFIGGAGDYSALLSASSGATITNNQYMEFRGGAGKSSGAVANSGEMVNGCVNGVGATIDVYGGGGEFSGTLFTSLQGTTINRGSITPGVSVGQDPVIGACPEDMTTERSIWDLNLTGGLGGTCGYKVTQTGTDLFVEARCDTAGPGSFTGTIDPDTGVFSVDGSYRDACTNSASLTGTVVTGPVVEDSIIFGRWTCDEPAGSDLCPGQVDCHSSGDFDGVLVDDTDDDFVADSVDNCDFNANPHQENSSGNDNTGDMCDALTINAIWEAGSSFHATTPFYRARVSLDDAIQFSVEEGFFDPDGREPDIGHPEADDSKVIQVAPATVSGLTEDPLQPNLSATLQQSSWHSIMSPDLYDTDTGTIRLHSATHANGLSMAYEINLDDIPSGTDVEIAYAVVLPAGWSLDQSETQGNTVPGRLTIKDSSDKPQVRISPTRFVAFGHETSAEDNEKCVCNRSLLSELGFPVECPNDPDALCGTVPYGGIHAPHMQTIYTLAESQADSDNARTTVTPFYSAYIVSMVVDADLIERNRESSAVILVGQTWSSLTAVDFGTDETVYGRHIVGFDEEAVISGTNVTLDVENTIGSPPTFDGLDADYDLLPNAGGTAAIEDWLEQGQTGVGCSGCSWKWQGDSKIQFGRWVDSTGGICSEVGTVCQSDQDCDTEENQTCRPRKECSSDCGGAGLGISSGGRLGPAHPCNTDPLTALNLDTNEGRCAENKVKRAEFEAGTLLIEGSMGGLAAAESDIDIEELTFYQARDPNVSEDIALHAAGGVGCAADSGVRLGQNPCDGEPGSAGEILSTGPIDFPIGCSEDDVGRLDCLPTFLSPPPGTGICNFSVRRMELQGMASWNNLLGTDKSIPSGCGATLAFRAGTGQIGPKAYNPVDNLCVLDGDDPEEPSVIEGFECMIAVSGGANVDGATGEPLSHDVSLSPSPVPPNVYCLDRIRGDDLEAGLSVGPNADVRASRLNIEQTDYCAVTMANVTANVANVANTTGLLPDGCPSVDGVTCRHPAQDLCCETCKWKDVDFLAIAGAGLTAPTKLILTESTIGLDENGNPLPSGNPILGNGLHDEETLVAECETALTIGRRQACMANTPICVSKGADTILYPELAYLYVDGSNIRTSSPSVSIDNLDCPGAENDITMLDNCYSSGAEVCEKESSLVGTAAALPSGEADPEILATNAEVVEQAASVPKPAGTEVPGDHKCYSVSAKGATSVDQELPLVDDVFGIWTTATVLQPFEFCNPVDRDGRGILEPEAHLTCYDLSEQTPAVPTVHVSTTRLGEFGEHTVALGDANRLCVPTGLDLPFTDLEGRFNSFKCYERAKRAKKVPDGLVELTDQFEENKFAWVKDLEEGPFLVCNAVDSGYGIVEPPAAQHLACFKIQDAGGQPKFPATNVGLDNQFGESVLELSKARLLCLPANVQPVSP